MSRYGREKRAAGRVDARPYNVRRSQLPDDGCLVSHQAGHCCCKQDGLGSCVFEQLPGGTWRRRPGSVSITYRLFGGVQHTVGRIGSEIGATALCGAAVPADAVYWMSGKEPAVCAVCAAVMDAHTPAELADRLSP